MPVINSYDFADRFSDLGPPAFASPFLTQPLFPNPACARARACVSLRARPEHSHLLHPMSHSARALPPHLSPRFHFGDYFHFTGVTRATRIRGKGPPRDGNFEDRSLGSPPRGEEGEVCLL